jgi:MFS family permease
MPRVPKSSLHRLDAPVDAVRAAAVRCLGATEAPDGSLLVPPVPGREPEITVTLRITDGASDAACTHLEVEAAGRIDIPFFAGFFRPLVRVARRRAVAHAVAAVCADLDGAPPPRPPRTVVGLPSVAFTHEQRTLLATASAATAVVAFSGALLGQLAGPVKDAFGATDARMGVVLALTRVGALIALFVIALADRRGRRRSILIGVVGSSFACAVTAVTPNLGVLTGAQIVQRGLLITTATVAGIAVIEEAPEQARAYSASMLALAGGLGFSLAVVVLPFADIGDWGWRIPFALGALSVLLARPVARHLAETRRYAALTTRADVVRGRAGDVWRFHRRRFVLLALTAFFTNLFNAPSSQLMNTYLTDERGFSNTGVALFRSVTTAMPGLVGLLLGGRLAEVRGRRPVAAIALVVATTTQMVFFLTGGPVIWWMSAISVLAAATGGIALGTLDAELFPTEVRSTSNGLLTVVAVAGSAAGFGFAGGLSDPLGGLGRSIALTGIGALFAALVIVPRLPESAAHALDEVSPTHTEHDDEYGRAP